MSESGSGQLITPGEHNITAYIEITFLISFDNYNYTQKQDELENEIICTISNFSHSNTHRIVLVPDEGESLGNFTVLKIYLVSANNEYDLLATEQVFYNISSEEMVFKEQLRMATGLVG